MAARHAPTDRGTGTATGTPVPDSVMPQSAADAHTSTGNRPVTGGSPLVSTSSEAARRPVAAPADGHGADTARPSVSTVSGREAATDVRSDGRSVAASVAVVKERVERSGNVPDPASAVPVAASWPRHWPRPQLPDTATIEATRAWLSREIEAGHRAASAPVPLFGTAAWVALPDSEPAKWVALFRSARAAYAEYLAIPETTAAQLREERERFAAWVAERDRADGQLFRAFVLDTVQMIERRERRERDAATRTLPNRSGPQLVAAARASWAWLDGPDTDTTAGSGPDSAEVTLDA